MLQYKAAALHGTPAALSIRTEASGGGRHQLLVLLTHRQQLSWNSAAVQRITPIEFPFLNLRIVFRVISHPAATGSTAAAADSIVR